MSWGGLLWAWVLLWGTGALFLGLLRARPPAGVYTLATDFLAGAFLLGIVGTGILALGLPLTPVPFYLLLLTLGVSSYWQGRAIPLTISFVRDPIAKRVVVLASILPLCLFFSASQDRLWWDGWSVWALKARIFFTSGGFPSDFFGPGTPFWSANPDYPLLLPLVNWWGFVHARSSDGAYASLNGALFFFLVVLLVWGGLRRRVGDRMASFGALLVASFWPLGYYAAGGTADILMAVALVGVVIELGEFLETRASPVGLRLSLFLCLGVLAKHEGRALLLVTVVIALFGWVLLHRQLRFRRLVLIFVAPLLFLVGWIFFLQTKGRQTVVGRKAVEVFQGELPAQGEGVLGKNVMIFISEGGAILNSIEWWLLLLLLLLTGAGAATMGGRRVAAGGGVWIGYACCLVAVYLMAPADLKWLLTTSLSRTFSVLVPALVYLAVLSLSSWDSNDGLNSNLDEVWPQRNGWGLRKVKPGLPELTSGAEN